MQDQRLARRHRGADYFFDPHPVNPRARLRRIFEVGMPFSVEIETHPIRNEEYTFLMNGHFQYCADKVRIANGYALRSRSCGRPMEVLV
jgi:hypothetical protein